MPSLFAFGGHCLFGRWSGFVFSVSQPSRPPVDFLLTLLALRRGNRRGAKVVALRPPPLPPLPPPPVLRPAPASTPAGRTASALQWQQRISPCGPFFHMEDDVVLQTLQVGFRPSGMAASSSGPESTVTREWLPLALAAPWSAHHSRQGRGCRLPMWEPGPGRSPLDSRPASSAPSTRPGELVGPGQ